jgi:hypothetical protein
VWVVESQGIDFKVDETNADVTHNYTIDIYPGQTLVGNAHDGMSIDYGGCRAGSISSAWINYTINSVPPCGYLKVVGYQYTMPMSTDCAGNLHEAGASYFWFEFGGTCGGECYDISPLPVEESTWGKVKALYKD